MKFKNPILPGFYPDPSICRVGEDYYLVNSSFEYFPGVPIFHSRDLVNWKQIGHCLTRESQLNLHKTKCSDGIYAPTLRYHQGRFYMATTNCLPERGFQNFFVHTDDPAGEWSEPVWVEQGGIDPSLFFDEDGKVYWTGNGSLWASVRGIYQSEIDISTGKLLSEIKFIWPGTGGSYPESPHLFKRGKYYYLSIAEGGTAEGHMVTVARATTPFGPFESCPLNPVLTHRSLMNPIQATGHADFFEDHQGNWWAVFLGFRYANGTFHNLGRETFLAPVEWNTEGWPVVNGNKKVLQDMEVARNIPLQVWPSESKRDDFDEKKLRHFWNFLRNPGVDDWSLAARPGSLTLRCAEASLNDQDAPAFLGRRQQHFLFRASTHLYFKPQVENEEAGLTVLLSDQAHCEIALTRRSEKTVVIVRRRLGSLQIEIACEPVSETTQVLTVESDRNWYYFNLGDKRLAQVEVSHLSSEVAGGYTGVLLGLYATAHGKASLNKAFFDWFEYEEISSALTA